VPLSITSILPNVGSTDGGTTLKIIGTGFKTGAIVTIGGIQRSIHVENASTIHLTAPQHGAGDADVVVTSLDRQTATLGRGYTFALPQSFDFNGDSEGGADVGGFNHGEEISIRFTIRNNTLTSVSCGTSEALIVTPPAPINNGQFSFSPSETVSMSGRILSAPRRRERSKLHRAGLPGTQTNGSVKGRARDITARGAVR